MVRLAICHGSRAVPDPGRPVRPESPFIVMGVEVVSDAPTNDDPNTLISIAIDNIAVKNLVFMKSSPIFNRIKIY
jgi:hypothetical protein